MSSDLVKEGKSGESTGSVSVQDNASSASSDNLLTVEPIEYFHKKFHPISLLGQHFGFIDATVGRFLQDDPNADTLRSCLVSFNIQMYQVISHLDNALSQARLYYTHNHEQYAGRDLDSEITEERVKILLDSKFQSHVVEYARDASDYFQSAAKSLRESALPLLPPLTNELSTFVEDFCERYYKLKERESSWIPSFVLDFFLGSVDPTTWNIIEVEVLPDDVRTGGALLHQLAPILDEMSIHFLRLSEVKPAELAMSGYSTTTDLKRLYSIRMACNKLLLEMDDMTFPMSQAFVTGTV